MCNFVGAPIGKLEIDKLLEYCNAVTGWDMDLGELIRVAQRSETLMRLFNCREGRTAADDVLPRRMFEPLENGALKGVALSQAQFQEARKHYYELMGWDAVTGCPTRQKIEQLGLEWAV
jgi:aldehyde:ferredoxin oxidoreductase